MLNLNSVLVSIGLLVLLSASAPAAEWLNLRSGLPNRDTNFVVGGHRNVIFLGSETLAGAGASKLEKSYYAATMRTLRAEFPGAGMGQPVVTGGKGSWWAACCAANGQAVYGTHLPGSIMFLELAGDDEGRPEGEVMAALEGLVRQVWTRAPATDIVFLYPLRADHLALYRQGLLPAVVQWHERVAEHYGIASANLGAYALQQAGAPEQLVDESGLHPNDAGHALAAEAIRELVVRSKAAMAPAARRVMPAALTAAPMLKGQCVPYELAKTSGKWLIGQRSPLPTFRHVAVATEPEAVMTLRFKGASVGCFDVAGPDAADLEAAVDGGAWQVYRTPAAAGPVARQLAAGLDPATWHELRLRVAEKQRDPQPRALRVGALLVDGDLVSPYEGMTALQRHDAVYAAMDQLQYTAAPARWELLPQTMRRLREGGELKIVLLGDSIMNQTYSSGFVLLLQRLYPQVKITAVASVRGSTGCWWYKDDDRVEEYVLKHQPDLLMIGGVSQRDDVDSIRTVIQQVRAKQQPEIMLLTPAFGHEGVAFIKEWTYDIRPGEVDYRGKLQRLAADEKCEFLDLTGPWWQYVQQSGKTYGWFRGDAVHANERGQQILARILEAYFRPKQ